MSSSLPAPGAAPLPRCWRCGNPFPSGDPACPLCQAPRRRAGTAAAARDHDDAARPVVHALVLFACLLAVSLLFRFAGSATTPRAALQRTFVFEAIDTVLIGISLLTLGLPRPPRASDPIRKAVAWGLSVPALATALAANRAYHAFLSAYLGLRPEPDPVVAATGVTPFVALLYCLQPALVEELFFRRFALDTLAGVLDVHLAVFTSSLMFGLAHVGAPLSVPVLVLLGVMLGYARVLSGGLLLPMLLHFFHNAIVIRG